MDKVYPVIAVEVPHVQRVIAYPIESEEDLKELCMANAGDNWDWPGYYSREETWICTATLEDYLDAFRHDLHSGFVLWGQAETLAFLAQDFTTQHQGFQIQQQVVGCARGLDWI